MIPSNDKIIQCMQFSFESILMPKIDGDYEKSQGMTMLNLFRYTRELAEREGPMLWSEKKALVTVLEKVAAYLATVPSGDVRSLQQDLGLPLPQAPEGYPSIEYLNSVVVLLKAKLDAALSYLVGVPKAAKADPAYRAIRQSIRDYLVDNIQRDDELMRASFTSRRR
jgi:hypothetical protein